MDLPSMWMLAARIALTPANLTLRVLFAMANQWRASAVPAEEGDPLEPLDVDEYWTHDPVLMCPHTGTRCVWLA